MDKRYFLPILLLGFSHVAQAHPTSAKGTLAVMNWNQPFMSDYWIAYSLDPRFALAARGLRMEMPAGQLLVYMPQVDFLLARWNNPDSQANIYAYGGYGGFQLAGRNGGGGLVGIEADAESRSWFVSAKWEATASSFTQLSHGLQFRVGFAPYEAGFDEFTSWLMIQAQYHPDLTTHFALTPLYRIFYRNFLAEVGVSLRGEWMLNFMFHF